MSSSIYYVVSGIIFGLVALLHLMRLIYRLPVKIGSFILPIWLSWGGLVFATGLCAWAFRLLADKR